MICFDSQSYANEFNNINTQIEYINSEISEINTLLTSLLFDTYTNSTIIYSDINVIRVNTSNNYNSIMSLESEKFDNSKSIAFFISSNSTILASTSQLSNYVISSNFESIISNKLDVSVFDGFTSNLPNTYLSTSDFSDSLFNSSVLTNYLLTSEFNNLTSNLPTSYLSTSDLTNYLLTSEFNNLTSNLPTSYLSTSDLTDYLLTSDFNNLTSNLPTSYLNTSDFSDSLFNSSALSNYLLTTSFTSYTSSISNILSTLGGNKYFNNITDVYSSNSSYYYNITGEVPLSIFTKTNPLKIMGNISLPSSSTTWNISNRVLDIDNIFTISQGMFKSMEIIKLNVNSSFNFNSLRSSNNSLYATINGLYFSKNTFSYFPSLVISNYTKDYAWLIENSFVSLSYVNIYGRNQKNSFLSCKNINITCPSSYELASCYFESNVNINIRGIYNTLLSGSFYSFATNNLCDIYPQSCSFNKGNVLNISPMSNYNTFGYISTLSIYLLTDIRLSPSIVKFNNITSLKLNWASSTIHSFMSVLSFDYVGVLELNHPYTGFTGKLNTGNVGILSFNVNYYYRRYITTWFYNTANKSYTNTQIDESRVFVNGAPISYWKE